MTSVCRAAGTVINMEKCAAKEHAATKLFVLWQRLDKYANVAHMKTANNIITLITHLAHALEKTYTDPLLCEQYAWWIIEALTQSSKTKLLLDQTIILTDEQQQKFDHWLVLLMQEKMPLQYLLSSVPFNTVDILVKPPTLIPRPETEEWCADLIELLKTLPKTNLSILDLCCGSGCIAIALAKALPHVHVLAVDISLDALALTDKNTKHNSITNVTTLQSDLFNNIPRDLRFDLIVSNPPYIAPEDWGNLSDSVTAWEDRQALIADDHGLAILKKIIEQAPYHIKKNEILKQHSVPQLMLEIDYQQGKSVCQLMQALDYNDIHVKKDLEGKDRVVIGRVDDVAITQHS